MASLGDILAGAATGKDPDYQNIEATAALKGATFQDTMAQIPLRGAQTEQALQSAEKARLEARALQRRQDVIDKQREAATNAAPGTQPAQPTLADLFDLDSNAQQATAAQGNLQTNNFESILGDKNADPQTRLAASSALTHKLESPFAKLDPETVNVTNPTNADGSPNEHLSQIGEATIGGKNAAADLANAKAGQITSTDNSVDPNEIAYHAHLFNVTGTAPSFGMGQSKLRQYFLKAAYLDAAGLPINAQTLGIEAGNLRTVPAPTPTADGTVTAGGGGTRTPNNPLDRQVPVDAPNPADNAPAGGGAVVPTAAVVPAAPAGPLSPTDAANATAGQRVDTKNSTIASNNASKMLGIVQAQAYKAHQSFGRALAYADQLAKQRGPDGSPLINQAFLDWKNGVTGNPLTADFVHEITVAHEEYGKIISGATGAAGITDAGRKQADDLFNKYMNAATLHSLGPIMDKDANDARMGFVNTINAARAGVSQPGSHGLAGQPGTDAANATPTPATLPPAAAAALKPGKITTFGNSQKWRLGPDGKTPVQVQ